MIIRKLKFNVMVVTVFAYLGILTFTVLAEVTIPLSQFWFKGEKGFWHEEFFKGIAGEVDFYAVKNPDGSSLFISEEKHRRIYESNKQMPGVDGVSSSDIPNNYSPIWRELLLVIDDQALADSIADGTRAQIKSFAEAQDFINAGQAHVEFTNEFYNCPIFMGEMDEDLLAEFTGEGSEGLPPLGLHKAWAEGKEVIAANFEKWDIGNPADENEGNSFDGQFAVGFGTADLFRVPTSTGVIKVVDSVAFEKVGSNIVLATPGYSPIWRIIDVENERGLPDRVMEKLTSVAKILQFADKGMIRLKDTRTFMNCPTIVTPLGSPYDD